MKGLTLTDKIESRPMSFADALGVLVGLRERTAHSTDDMLAFVNFCLHNIGWSHGQHLQDLWVAYELKSRRNGYFVEFGAMDGIKFSNSYALETHLGWNGIVSEPARIWHSLISNNRTCAVDRRCVWTQSGEVLTFNQTPIQALSTIDRYSGSDEHAAQRQDGKRYDVESVSLDDLLTFWNAPRRIDYLSIDTEGSELDILTAFDWSRHEIRMITVEHNYTENRAALFDLLGAKGYKRKFESLSRTDDWYVLAY